ncbi:MAG: AmmeMemoRadiSam system protein B [bacterium JZ-2024 1]
MSDSFLNRPIPMLRALDIRYWRHEGKKFLIFRDPLRLSEKTLILREEVSGILAFFDGERDAQAVSAAISVRYGVRIPPQVIADIAQALAETYLLDDEAFRGAMARALQEYRARPFRRPALAGTAYPDDPCALNRYLAELEKIADNTAVASVSSVCIRGIISPHIDYARGGPIYAQTWRATKNALASSEVAIILGTDHYARKAELTLTRQNYATPLGTLPTDTDLVNRFAEALGPDAAFANEIHHTGEHSIELAILWLQYFRPESALPIVPVLVGSFADYISGGRVPEEVPGVRNFVAVMREIIAERNPLVVVAGDLAHLGPAFGMDPVTDLVRQQVRSADYDLIEAMTASDRDKLPERFASHPYYETICGLSPLYIAAKALQPTTVRWIAYDQCPADRENESLVSICGALLA